MKYVALSLIAAASAFAQANLSGNWMLNLAASEYGQFPAPQVMMRTIAQEPNAIRLSTFQKGAQGELNSELRYSTDGKPSTNGDSTGTARWDGARLVIESTRKVANQGKANELKSREEWTLSADGKTLTIVTKIELPQQGGFEVKQVFEKMPGASTGAARANY
jgi:hypothetical protein